MLILAFGNRALTLDFRRRLLDVGALRSWYAPAIVVIPVGVVLLSVALSLLWGESAEQFRFAPDLSGAVPLIVIGVLLAPAIEELGWRGYGVDSIRAKMGLLGTSLVFGLLWSLWHAPLVWIEGTYQHEFATMDNPLFLANFFVSIVALSMVMNWLYYRLDRSIPAAMAFHAMVNLMAMGLAAGPFSKVLVTILYAAIAVALVVATRGFAADEPHARP